MFIYEKGNTINLTFSGLIPVENPEVVIEGFKNGAKVTVNGTSFGVTSKEEPFEGKAKTFVYQRDGKLMITFKGVEGMSDPDVVIDEVSDKCYSVTAGNTTKMFTVDNNSITAHTHKYTVKETIDATCTTPGKKVEVCTCGAIKETEISVVAHNYVEGVCTVCGAEESTEA